jgi:hypothetical protein
MRTLSITDFSGGWNPRDAWSAVADNELPDALNVTLDERGGITKRLGLTKYNSSQMGSDALENVYYSAALNLVIAQQGTTLYKSTPGSGTFSSFHTLSAGGRCCFVDFNSRLVFANSTDAFRQYDGTTVSAAISNAPVATTAAVWQNAIWSAGSAVATRVTRSDLGTYTWPASPVTVDIRAKDDKPITCIGGGAGMDTQGRDGMFVWKEDSFYRLHDSATGAYTVVDLTYGAGGPLAVTTNQGITCAIGNRGVIAVRGGEDAPVVVSEKLSPVFRDTQLNMTQQANLVAANYRDRMVFSLARLGSTANNMTLEFHPTQGWFVPHSFGLACATTLEKTGASTRASKLYGGAAASGYVYDVFTGGSDDGSSIAGRFQMRWMELNNGNKVRYRKLIVNGRGTFGLYFKTDYASGAGELFPVRIEGTGALWGSAAWGDGSTWASDVFQDYAEMYSLGWGRSFSIECQETSTTSASGPRLLDDGTAETIGAFSVYGFNLQFERLGLA